jgi:hypothetical protein
MSLNLGYLRQVKSEAKSAGKTDKVWSNQWEKIEDPVWICVSDNWEYLATDPLRSTRECEQLVGGWVRIVETPDSEDRSVLMQFSFPRGLASYPWSF